MLDQLTTRSTLLEAFTRVQENAGCRGADGVTVGRFAANLQREIDSLQDRLLRRCYRPFPLLRFPVPKLTSGIRHLSVPTVRDRVLQTAVYLVTREVFEACTDEALELSDYLLEQLALDLNREKTVTTSFDQGFKFLGAVFLKDDVYLPFDRKKIENDPPVLPPPLDLLTYLELREEE